VPKVDLGVDQHAGDEARTPPSTSWPVTLSRGGRYLERASHSTREIPGIDRLGLREPVLVNYLFFKTEHTGILQIHDNPNPVRLGKAKGFHPGEVFNLAP
jgi:hypothetical protein